MCLSKVKRSHGTAREAGLFPDMPSTAWPYFLASTVP